ncbi:MAG: hypothetical protein RI907_1458 [Pseudomonadota bacterium]|jgi:hypothetical protein
MQPNNQQICLSGEEALAILSEINLVMISLRSIGDAYLNGGLEYERETTRFIDEWKVTARLANARKILSGKFDKTLGADEMDDEERAAELLPYWTSINSRAPSSQ